MFASKEKVLERIAKIREHELLPELEEEFRAWGSFTCHERVPEKFNESIFRRVKNLPRPTLYFRLAENTLKAMHYVAIHQWANGGKALEKVDTLIELLLKPSQ